ncbi:MAG: hypothetical protein ABII26_10085 [Pseudomonadota bacterium]
MLKSVLKRLLFTLLWLQCGAVYAMEFAAWQPLLIKNIPPRPHPAITGSEFAKQALGMDEDQREQAILAQLLEGNMPEFLRKLGPVRLRHKFEDGRIITATIFVMPDYLAIGSNRDFLRIPMNLYTATAIARQFGFILPTKKMVDAIYEQSAYCFRPEPLPPGPQMRSTVYYLTHNRKIKKQRLVKGLPLGGLVSGHKKDVVITNRLAPKHKRIAIYGWHHGKGDPIQPLSTVHGARYADYSHGIRLVSEIVLIDGKPRYAYDILRDPKLSSVLSEEGAIQNLPKIMGTWGRAGRELSLMSPLKINKYSKRPKKMVIASSRATQQSDVP